MIKTMIVKLESGKELKYHGTRFELMQYRARIADNEIRRHNLGMEVDKAIKFEITDCEY